MAFHFHCNIHVIQRRLFQRGRKWQVASPDKGSMVHQDIKIYNYMEGKLVHEAMQYYKHDI